jgi:nucleoredoxin
MRAITHGLLSLVLTGLWAATAKATQAGPPETLGLADLANRPERWPALVKLGRDFDFGGGQGARAGQQVRVLDFNGGQVLVDAGKDLLFEIAPADCDLLAAAQAAWQALAPAQRAVDQTLLLQDASLWPERATCFTGFQLDSGTLLAANGEYDFLGFENENVKLFAREHGSILLAGLGQTDVIARARQRVLLEPDQRPARMVAALKSVLVGADGKPVAPAALENAGVFVLYYGASWCGPCRKFSPRLVEFVQASAAGNPRLFTVLMSNDEQDADMLEYMRDEKMPWPAVPLASMRKAPFLLGYAIGSIPNLVVVDRYGRVLASSVQGGAYRGPDFALDALKKLLESGVAR